MSIIRSIGALVALGTLALSAATASAQCNRSHACQRDFGDDQINADVLVLYTAQLQGTATTYPIVVFNREPGALEVGYSLCNLPGCRYDDEANVAFPTDQDRICEELFCSGAEPGFLENSGSNCRVQADTFNEPVPIGGRRVDTIDLAILVPPIPVRDLDCEKNDRPVCCACFQEAEEECVEDYNCVTVAGTMACLHLEYNLETVDGRKFDQRTDGGVTQVALATTGRPAFAPVTVDPVASIVTRGDSQMLAYEVMNPTDEPVQFDFLLAAENFDGSGPEFPLTTLSGVDESNGQGTPTIFGTLELLAPGESLIVNVRVDTPEGQFRAINTVLLEVTDPQTERGVPVSAAILANRPCPSDVDGNGSVDFLDLVRLLSNWGPYDPCPPFAPDDVDEDCNVGFTDVIQLLSDWGVCG